MQIFKRNTSFIAFDVSELWDVNDPELSKIWSK